MKLVTKVVLGATVFTASIVGLHMTDYKYAPEQTKALVVPPSDFKIDDFVHRFEEQKKKQEDIDSRIEKLRKQQATRNSFDDNLKCLADNIYYEAGSEPYEGKIAVAQVTLNRFKHPDYPKTICGVVYERHRTKANRIAAAFSWTLTPYRPKGPKSKTVYEEVVEIARNVLTNKEKSDIIDEDVKFYHAVYCHPDWAHEHEQVARIGNHIFYK